MCFLLRNDSNGITQPDFFEGLKGWDAVQEQEQNIFKQYWQYPYFKRDIDQMFYFNTFPSVKKP